jgi:pimeloyl-ACP methyl ester carboxylesterase
MCIRQGSAATAFVVALAMAVSACATTEAAFTGGPTVAGEAQEAATRFANAPDGTRIAYDVSGEGPVLMLLHGAGQTRAEWDAIGYLGALSERFTVVRVDLRGFGDSAKPTEPAAYAIDRLVADLVAVADGVKAGQFHVWGYGRGAIIGRHLAAAHPDRVQSLVYVGVPFGPALSETLAMAAKGLHAKWQPIFDARKENRLGEIRLTDSDKETLQRGTLEVLIASQVAMLDYPPMDPTELTVPTLWLVGTADEEALESARAWEGKLEGSPVTLVQVSGANYSDMFTRVNQMLEHGGGFLTKQLTR